MFIPLNLQDISLWLGSTALILLITSELLSYLPIFALRFIIEKQRLRLAGFGCGLGFLVTLAFNSVILSLLS